MSPGIWRMRDIIICGLMTEFVISWSLERRLYRCWLSLGSSSLSCEMKAGSGAEDAQGGSVFGIIEGFLIG